MTTLRDLPLILYLLQNYDSELNKKKNRKACFSVILKHFLLYIVFLHRKKIEKTRKNNESQFFDHFTQWVNYTLFSFISGKEFKISTSND